MTERTKITDLFGAELAVILSDKIRAVHPTFDKEAYVEAINKQCGPLNYTKRVELHASELHNNLPVGYPQALNILLSILGEENRNETGMFKEYYWVMPIGKYVEVYGLQHFELSMQAIEEITKRNTGEYAIRAFVRQYPKQTLEQMTEWAQSDNFHLRRLASEGLRPKLPWSTKLTVFLKEPEKVFAVLELLKQDEVMFVKRSVANHMTDWLKVNREPTAELLRSWRESDNVHTQWIVKKATKKIEIDTADS
ncbi:DNA alkylation repair enzyme [Alkalibacterium sp. AK22]|uniref:DNA alkylation repair protein n=1 Tax=Alkalibacterium sp. AK22 TaxID=1229520 RepID=UPI0004505784|nr:DNA alkylation repair protein [Alkalibacterium sp. AK22]EXJ22974.1 DNA alkylation repair enzyme [Alkalibacterium sp. AK22]